MCKRMRMCTCVYDSERDESRDGLAFLLGDLSGTPPLLLQRPRPNDWCAFALGPACTVRALMHSQPPHALLFTSLTPPCQTMPASLQDMLADANPMVVANALACLQVSG